MNFKPCFDMLIVTMEEKERTVGGLYIPKTGVVEWVWGEVLAVGDGALLVDGSRVCSLFKVGDRVMYQKLAAIPMEIAVDRGTTFEELKSKPQAERFYLLREAAVGVKEVKSNDSI